MHIGQRYADHLPHSPLIYSYEEKHHYTAAKLGYAAYPLLYLLTQYTPVQCYHRFGYVLCTVATGGSTLWR